MFTYCKHQFTPIAIAIAIAIANRLLFVLNSLVSDPRLNLFSDVELD
tara:strand:+ start:585 stop:725 length:141 start_codon:yes stop_codon:yes gene_type:complete